MLGCSVPPADSEPEQLELRARLLLHMLAPFRVLTDLKRADELWCDAWLRFESTCAPCVRHIREHIDDYHLSKMKARQEAATRKAALAAGRVPAVVDDVVASALDPDDPDNADLFDVDDAANDDLLNAALAALEHEQVVVARETAAFAAAALGNVDAAVDANANVDANAGDAAAAPAAVGVAAPAMARALVTLDAATLDIVNRCAAINVGMLDTLAKHQKTAIDRAVAASRATHQVCAPVRDFCFLFFAFFFKKKNCFLL